MRSVRIEGTSIRTSRLGFGTSSLHHLTSRAARQRLLASAWNAGIRYFDTAPIYGHEMAERELGRFTGGRRSEMILTTKIGDVPNAWFSRFPQLMYADKALVAARRIARRRPRYARPPRDFTVEHTRQRLERSLNILRTDYVDILYLQEPALEFIPAAPALLECLQQLQREGKIREFGLSGTLDNCMGIARRCPALTRVVQLEVEPHFSSTVGIADNRRAQVTYGHFRNARNRGPNDPETAARGALWQARILNPDGVVLFSTRDPARAAKVAELLGSMDEVDPAQSGDAPRS